MGNKEGVAGFMSFWFGGIRNSVLNMLCLLCQVVTLNRQLDIQVVRSGEHFELEIEIRE